MRERKIYVVEGDLLKSDCNVIIHQANCFATMGAGIAKQIVNLYPEVLTVDRNFRVPVGDKRRLGKTSHVWVDGPYNRLLVINLYAQYNYGRYNRTPDQLNEQHEAFRIGMESIMKRLEKLGPGRKIGLPYGIGCGLAGGNWSVIYSILEDMTKKYDRDIYLYKLK
ncbi:hypothetical protein QO179_25050 [Bacillus stercoris]|nr:hypothetical protein [Bacillus stercoris]